MIKRKRSYFGIILIISFALGFLLWRNVQANVEEKAVGDVVENEISMLEGTVVAILEDEVLFVAELNLSEEHLNRTPEEWFESDQVSDVYRLGGIEADIQVGSEIRISFAIMTFSLPPFVPVISYEII